MSKLIIAGGSGFLGNVLIEHFKNSFSAIIILTRTSQPDRGIVKYVLWDAKTLDAWAKEIDGADVLINLTGKSVDCRYSEENKSLILSSRLDSTKILGEAIIAAKNPPRIWLNSSTATIYRHSLDMQMYETTGEIGDGFSVDVAKAWEKVFFSFKLKNTRQVALRTSIVFGKNGGAFVPIKKLVKLGFGGKQGGGDQKVSWIHQTDFARSIQFIIENKALSGYVNIVSPQPTTNKILMEKLRNAVGMPFGIPMPTPLLKFGAKLIKTETELILKSRNVIPQKLQESGFAFSFGSLDEAINDLI